MKNLFSLFVFCFAMATSAQVITFPDPNFKAILLAADVTNEIAQNNYPLQDNMKIDANNNGEIEVAEALAVERLNIDNANLTSLVGIENFANLLFLGCSNNQLTTLDLTFRPYMESIDCSNNLLTEVNFPPIEDEGVVISNNLIETLHLEAHLGFTFFMFDCSNNPNLQSLFIKDTFIETIYSPNYFDPIYLSNCPNLNYICAKDSDIPNIVSAMNTNGNSNCVVNSYCSFNPPGQFYVVQGNVKVDFNGNGCTASDSIYPNMNFVVTNGTTSGNFVANTSGTYSIPLSAGSYTITPVLENPNYYSISPSSITVTFPNTSPVFLQDFCLTPLPINDVEVSILPLTQSSPGLYSSFKIKYKNKGDTTQSGTLSFAYDGTILELSSAFPSTSSSTSNILTWNFSNLLPLESREIIVILLLNTPTDTPPVNSGDVLNFIASISGIGSDFHPEDNTFTLNQTVVNSIDPNDKTCLEGATITPDKVGEYVHYMIRFENTGTANAQNIVVKDIIDTTKFDIATLVPLDGSHSFVTRISNSNQVEFIFENIQLPFDDANNDGYVAFKIKTKPTLATGSSFSNSASIYFDYNFPIVTNTATTIIQALGNQDFEFSNYFELAPNPAKNVLNIHTKNEIELSSISIYNTLGQLVLVIPNAKETNSIDVSKLTSGTYFVKVVSNKGSSNSKFMKE